MTDSCGTIAVTFSASATYTLTTSLVASDAFNVNFAKTVSIYGLYATQGLANKVSYTVEINPFDAATDPTGAYWSQVGIFTDSTGTWTEEKATYLSVASGAAGTSQTLTPLVIPTVNATQMRIKAKETISAGTAGTLKAVVVKNTFN